MVKVGINSILGCGSRTCLSKELVLDFQEKEIRTLDKFVDHGSTDIWPQGWLQAEALGLDGD